MDRLTVWIDRRIHKKVKSWAVRNDRKMGELLDEILTEWLAKVNGR
jgi:hypothetical protein